MKKKVVLFITLLMLCISMSNAFATTDFISTSSDIDELNQVVETTQSNKETMNLIKQTVDDYLNMDESLYKSVEQTQNSVPQPVLGGNEIFGLWINIVYKGQSFEKQVSITPQMIRGKLTDPKYRTPIRFDVDGDSLADIEAGFGFFKYGIDEIMPDGSSVNHPAWATAFDFMQIGDGLDDQMAELEVWQEFHVNLNILVSKSNAVTPNLVGIMKILLERLSQKLSGFGLLNKFIERLLNNNFRETIIELKSVMETEIEPPSVKLANMLPGGKPVQTFEEYEY